MLDCILSRAFLIRGVATAMLAIAIFAAQMAAADVVSIGSVNPIPPSAGGTFASTIELVVGGAAVDANNTNYRAWLSVDDGSFLQYGQLIVGDEEDFLGVVEVTGNFLTGKNTQFNFSGNGSTGDPTVQVGNEGTGFLTVDGAQMNVTANTSGNMSIGVATTGIGHVTITGFFTSLMVEDNIFVGQNGTGTLNILDGALVQTLDRSSSRFVGIGTTATGVGTLIVDGTNSLLDCGSNLIVGATIAGSPITHGQGTLIIRDGGRVEVDNTTLTTSATTTVGRRGRIELDGGTFVGNSPATGFGTTVNGFLGGSGLVRGTVAFNGDSSIEAGPGDYLRFDGNVSSNGAITINHGEMEFLAGFANNAPSGSIPRGRISLEQGTVRFTETLVNNGVISSSQDTNNVHGRITNQGTIIVASETVAVFHDPFTDMGGTIQVLPRGNALFLADLIFTSAAALEMSVGLSGTTDTSAQIGAGGLVALAGDLTVLIDGTLTPVVGDSFELISSAGPVTGTFNNTFLPNIPGPLEWRVQYNPTNVLMAVAIEGTAVTLNGDFNDDGVVDAADYTVWRNYFGDLNEDRINNAGNGGGVDDADYDVWKANYGRSIDDLGAGGLANRSATPEPTAFSLLVMAGVTFVAASGRRSRWRLSA